MYDLCEGKHGDDGKYVTIAQIINYEIAAQEISCVIHVKENMVMQVGMITIAQIVDYEIDTQGITCVTHVKKNMVVLTSGINVAGIIDCWAPAGETAGKRLLTK